MLALLCFSPFELFLQHFPIFRLLYIHGKFAIAMQQFNNLAPLLMQSLRNTEAKNSCCIRAENARAENAILQSAV
jgi:protein involved in temperature-dependent protein secretion